MSIGACVRRAMGPFEKKVANFYRGLFLDMENLVKAIRQYSDAHSILEIGCGEGAMTEQLVKFFPGSKIVAIDIAPTVGRLFDGDPKNVNFCQTSVDDFVKDNFRQFDLVLICDVLHHVPPDMQETLLWYARSLLADEGTFIFKEWESRVNLINGISYFLERYITGDKVEYRTLVQWRSLLNAVFGADAIKLVRRMRPWKNNIMCVINVKN